MTLLGKTTLRSLYLGVCIAGYILLFIQVSLSPSVAKYDEILFYPNIQLFQKYGLSEYFLLNIKNQAPGPLYQFIHFFFSPLSGLKFPYVRHINLLLLIFTQGLLYCIAKFQFKLENPLSKTLSLISVPMIWSIGGLALTEVPAMFFCLAAIFLYFAISAGQIPIINGALTLLCGISLSLAILGRVQFLVVFISIGLFLLMDVKQLLIFKSSILLIVITLCFPIFSLWKNLTPPTLHYQSETNFFYGFLALAYSSMAFLIVAPSWFHFKISHIRYYAALFLSALFINLTFGLFHYLGFNSLLSQLKHPELLGSLSLIIPCLFVPVSTLFLWSFFYRLYEQKNNKQQMFLYVCFLFLLLSSIKVSHLFSPRYVAQALPLAILMAAPYFTFSRWKLLIGVTGILIGSFSLNAYYVKQYNYENWSYRMRNLGPNDSARTPHP